MKNVTSTPGGCVGFEIIVSSTGLGVREISSIATSDEILSTSVYSSLGPGG